MADIEFKELMPQPAPAMLRPPIKAEVWGDDCVGNGVTIRNLQRALGEAESLIRNLKSRSHSSVSGACGSDSTDLQAALERKLLVEQSTSMQRENEVRALRDRVAEFEDVVRKVNERIIAMIKEDSWQLPSRISLPEVQRSENIDPEEQHQNALRLLEVLNDVRRDIISAKRKEFQTDAHLALNSNQEELRKCQSQLQEKDKQISHLQDEIENLHAKTVEHEDGARAARNELVTLRAELADLRDSADTLRGELEADVHKAKHEINQANAQSQALQHKVDNLTREKEASECELQVARERLQLIIERRSAATNTELGPETQTTAAQTSPEQNVDFEFAISRSSLKRPLSPTFGNEMPTIATVQSAQPTTDEDFITTASQEGGSVFASQASPTPHLDELFVGSRNNTPKVSTLRVTRARRKAVATVSAPGNMESLGEESGPNSSVPTTPVAADIDKRRSKRTKLAKATQ